MASEEIVGRWREGLQDGVGVVGFYPGESFVRGQLLFEDSESRLSDGAVSAHLQVG